MKKKFLEMQTSMSEHLDNIATLNARVARLQDENTVLNADVKVIRNEHSEMVHKVFDLEKKNSSLLHENVTLKDLLYGRATERQRVIPQPQ